MKGLLDGVQHLLFVKPANRDIQIAHDNIGIVESIHFVERHNIGSMDPDKSLGR